MQGGPIGSNYKWVPASEWAPACTALHMRSALCEGAERLRTACLEAGINYRDAQKRQILAVLHRDSDFQRFHEDTKTSRFWYERATTALSEHLAVHYCWAGC
jgi:hypothetical protein